MDATNKVPAVPLARFKRTKIIATVGPATDSYEQVLALIKSGANGLRLNCSHGTNEERERQIRWIRRASKVHGKPVAIIWDLAGPKIRLGDFEGIINIQTGQHLTFEYDADYERSGHIPTQYDLSKKVKRGESMFLFDGKIRTTIESVNGKLVHATAENDGILIKRKGINLPDTDFAGDIITKKDRENLAFSSTMDIDYVAQSFVQRADDLRAMRRLMKNLGVNAKLIVKFETRAAVSNMEEIVKETDVVMVARGDLAVETPAESVPIIQRKLIGLGLQTDTPTIVATQMLFSMTEVPEPTRAEVSDVATAVLVGADCVMLSDETAMGRYPLDAVKVMKRVITYTEENAPVRPLFNTVADMPMTRQRAICDTVVALADEIKADAIVAETKSGATALQIAARRTVKPIIAVTSDRRVANQLALVYGTKSYVRPDSPHQATKLTNWLRHNNVLAPGDIVVTASGAHPGVVGTTDTIKVRILE